MLWFFVWVLATGALARTVWVLPSEERVRWWAPPDRAADETGQVWLKPTPSKLVECGWIACEVGDANPEDCVIDYSVGIPVRAMTQEEIDARSAQQAQAEAEAEAQAALPQTSATGYAVLDETGHWVELIPTGDSLPVIGVRVSNSPLTPEERAAMKAERKAAHDALKAAAKDKKLNDKDKIALLMKAVFGVEE